MTRLLLILTFSLALSGQTDFVYYQQIPALARAGQSVKLRLRANGATRIVWEPIEGGAAASREMTRVAEGLWEVDITAPRLTPRDLYHRRAGYMRTFNGATPSFTYNAEVAYSDDLPPARITRLAGDAQRSDYVLNIQSRGFYDSMFPSSGIVRFDVEPLARRVYQLVQDDWDFINVIPGTYSVPRNRFHVALRSSVQGIGRLPSVDVATYGSAGRLQGYSVFPSPLIFDGADHGYSHEMAHQWINYIRTGLVGAGGAHWPLSSMSTNIMNFTDASTSRDSHIPCRFDVQANGDINIRPWIPGQTEFNDLDLYMMGLMAPNEVTMQYVVTDRAKIESVFNSPSPCIGMINSSQYQTIDANTIIATEGARVPSVDASQKDFRALHVVVSRDALLTPEEMAFFEIYTRRAEDRGPMRWPGSVRGTTKPWFAATRERSTLAAKISAESVPTIAYGGVVNAANFKGDAMGPATVVTLFGSDLALSAASASSTPLPTALNGVRVIVDGIPAPLFYVSPGQINFQLPDSLSTTRIDSDAPAYLALVRVERDGVASNFSYVEIRPTALGLMAYGDNYAVATDPSGALIGPDNPAIAGSPIVVYFVGAAPLQERVAAGQPAPTDRLIRISGGVTATLGGQGQAVTFAGLTPGGVGLYQANVFINGALEAGEYNFTITANNVRSNVVKIPVRRR